MLTADSRCPQQGYVPELRTKEPLLAGLHAFGFGYHSNSGLLKSIAEACGGKYSSIPDAGMIVRTLFGRPFSSLPS